MEGGLELPVSGRRVAFIDDVDLYGMVIRLASEAFR